MAFGDDKVIGGDDAPAEVAALTVAGPGTEAQAARYGLHFRASRLWSRREALGRPRTSTLVLMSVWVVALALYLELRPV